MTDLKVDENGNGQFSWLIKLAVPGAFGLMIIIIAALLSGYANSNEKRHDKNEIGISKNADDIKENRKEIANNASNTRVESAKVNAKMDALLSAVKRIEDKIDKQ